MCTKNADVKIYEPVQEKSGDGADGGEVTGLDADCVLDEISDGSYSEPTGLRLKVGLHLNCLANLFRFRPCVFFVLILIPLFSFVIIFCVLTPEFRIQFIFLQILSIKKSY